MDYSLHAYVQPDSYSTGMDYPSTNQALFALVVMIIVLLFILVYCCSGAFPCNNNSNSPEENITNLDPTGRRIRYPLLPRARRRSPAHDQTASRDPSGSRSAVVIVPVSGLVYCCDETTAGPFSDSTRSKPPAYGDLFKAPPAYSVGLKPPSPTPEHESIFPPAYEDSFKDWKLTFDNDNRFDLLHQSSAAGAAQPVPPGKLNDLMNGAAFTPSQSESSTLTSNIISVLAKDYNSPGATEAVAAPTELSRAATNSSTDSRNASRNPIFSINEQARQRGLEAGVFPSRTSHSADDLNNRISSQDEPPVTVNFNSRLSAAADLVYTGPAGRLPRASRVHGSHKFARSASANLPGDSSYYSNNDLDACERQRWSAEPGRDLAEFEQQRHSTVESRGLGGMASPIVLQADNKTEFRCQIKLPECRKDMEESVLQHLSTGKSEFKRPQLTSGNWLGEASGYRKQTSENDLNFPTPSSQGRNQDAEIPHRSEARFNCLENMNDRPGCEDARLNDLSSETHDRRSTFTSSPMNITDTNVSAMHGDPLVHRSTKPRNLYDARVATSPACQAAHSVQQIANYSRSSSDLHSTNNQRSLDSSRENFLGRIHASSFFGTAGNVRAAAAPEFQKELPRGSGTQISPGRVPDADVYSLIRDLTAAENQRRELPIPDRTKSCDSVDKQLK